MQQTIRYFLRTMIGAAVYALAMHASWAQSPAPGNSMQAGDPARWYQEDMTPRARLQTSTKEAGAAYREAQKECRTTGRASRAACMKDARAMYEQALAEARQQARESRR